MKKCSLDEHKNIEPICFCQECKIYMCNKCEKHHSELFKKHILFNAEKLKDVIELFTGFCKEENHSIRLNFFCKTHNVLCCAECITKVKTKDNGQHTNCDVCAIEDIEKDKKNKFKENIKSLEELSVKLLEHINELKIIFEKIDKNKEEIKMIIQKTFTKLRNALNNREDDLLSNVDKKYDELYLNEEIIKESEKLPNKIKISLEKGKEIEKNWNIYKFNSLINDC